MKIIKKKDLFDKLPEVQNITHKNDWASNLVIDGHKIVVLDDDPTGTQTVNNVTVLTGWSIDELEREILSDKTVFYILTNSRSMPLSQAERINREIGKNLQIIESRTGIKAIVISRGDSTLRGHFPGEIYALAQSILDGVDGCLLIPFFEEGGRYTISDIHYVQEDENLIPASMTSFADDAVFGYKSSDLKDWVQEKTGGSIKSTDVISVTIEDIRMGGIDKIFQRLRLLNNCEFCIINAACYEDVEIVVIAIRKAYDQGKRFLIRSAASFVPIAADLKRQPVLEKDNLKLSTGCGLTIIGSHVPKTTLQLTTLLEKTRFPNFELRVDRLLDPEKRITEIRNSTQLINHASVENQNIILYSSRSFVGGKDDQENLQISKTISMSLVEIVKNINFEPRFILSKGGITSSDIAAKALGVKRAQVLGQIAPGVPLWLLGRETRFPGLNYIVFPGNVGTANTLYHVVMKFLE